MKNDQTIVLNAFNTNGIGDAYHAIRGHSLCRRLMSHLECKTIISIEKSSLKALQKSVAGDLVMIEVYVFDTDRGLNNYNDEEALQAQYVIFSTKQLQNTDGTAKFLVYDFIHNHAPKLNAFLQRARVYLNFATKLIDSRNIPKFNVTKLAVQPKIFSFLELGAPDNKGMRSISQNKDLDKINCVYNEWEMGLYNGQVGIMVDEPLNDSLKPLAFTNPSLYKKITMQFGHLAVGYVQHLPLLRLAITALAHRSSSLCILSNISLITRSMLNTIPFTQFSAIKIYDNQGQLISQFKNIKPLFRTLSLFPFEGLSNQDKRYYLSRADSTFGSGDNSFAECISAGKPFIWDIQSYKTPFVSWLSIWLVRNNLITLAKLLYINTLLCFDSGHVDPKYLIAYCQMLRNQWSAICKEAQVFSQHVIKNANFADHLKILLLSPDHIKEPLITNSIDLELLEHQRDQMSSSKMTADRVRFFAFKDTLTDIKYSNAPKIIEFHLFGLTKKYLCEMTTNITQLTKIFAKDNVLQLRAWLDNHPYVDLTHPCMLGENITMLEYAVRENATQCAAELSNRHHVRGEDNLVKASALLAK